MKNSEKFMLNLIKQGVFSVDDEGRIWRHKIRGSRFRDYYPLPERRRAETTNNEYLELRVGYQGVSYMAKASRIVWVYFHGDIDDDLTINHKNGNKKDNRLENLELVSLRENLLHAHRTGLISGVSPGEAHPLARLTEADVLEILELYGSGQFTQVDLGIRFGVGATQISRIVRGKRWSYLKNPCDFSRYGAAKLTPEKVRALRFDFSSGEMNTKDLAEKYSISIVQVRRIIRRDAWKHI